MDLNDFLNIIKNNNINSTFFKTYYFIDNYGEILNKITRAVYNIKKSLSLELFKDYLV